MTNIIEQAEYIAIQAQKTTLDKLAHLFGLDQYEPPQPQRYRIYDGVDDPIVCWYCGYDDLWTERGGIWYCDHWGSDFLDLMPLTPADDVRQMSEVVRWVKV